MKGALGQVKNRHSIKKISLLFILFAFLMQSESFAVDDITKANCVKPTIACPSQGYEKSWMTGLFCINSSTIAHSYCVFRCVNAHSGYLVWALQDESYTTQQTCPPSRPACIKKGVIQAKCCRNDLSPLYPDCT